MKKTKVKSPGNDLLLTAQGAALLHAAARKFLDEKIGAAGTVTRVSIKEYMRSGEVSAQEAQYDIVLGACNLLCYLVDDIHMISAISLYDKCIDLTWNVDIAYLCDMMIPFLRCHKQEPEPVTNSEPVTVTEAKPAAKGYPPEVKRLALDLAERNEPAAKIRAAVLASCGRAPAAANWGRTLAAWQKAAQKD